jgi:hypothetical protein
MVYNYITSNGRILGECQRGRELEGSDRNKIEVLFRNFLGWTEKTPGMTAVIQSRYLLNTRNDTPTSYSTKLPVAKMILPSLIQE